MVEDRKQFTDLDLSGENPIIDIDSPQKIFTIQYILHRATEPHLLFPAIAIIVLVIIWGTTINFIRIAKTGAEQSTIIHGSELADTYEAQVLRAFREIDRTLKTVKYLNEQRNKQDILTRLKEKELLLPEILFTVSIVDDEGNVTASTHKIIDSNVSEKDFFQVQKEKDSFTAGKPQFNISENEWQLSFSRRLNSPDGGFDGIVFVTVDAAYFVSGYETSKFGQQGVLAILGSDNILRIARSGDTLSANSAVDYKEIKSLSENDETIISVTPWDNVKRYMYFREFYNLPLAVIVGLSVEERRAETNGTIQIYLISAATISFILIIVITILGRLSHQLAKTRKTAIEKQAEHTKKIKQIAYHDSLTLLPNRNLFTKILNQNLKQARRYNKQLAVLFIDLDGFKNINDSLGHDAGDQLLIDVAKRLKDCLRESDAIARLGGDEFVALLPELDDEKYATIVAEKILSVIANPYLILGKECFVSASIGISIFPQDGLDEQTLTKNADIAMYHAKETGKNNYQLYSEKLNNALVEKIRIESDLRHALERNQMKIHYQPKFHAPSGQINGVEALLRWQHPDLGELMPLQFLSIAENNGTIIPIEKWLIKKACEQNVFWQQQGLPEVCMSVNLSTRHFYDKNLIPDLSYILKESGMPAELLEIGIKEDLLSEDVDLSLNIVQQLKRIGVRVAIDNFGISFSSLLTLKEFPLDAIKINQSLASALSQISDNNDIIETIIDTGRTLGMNVLAQGIENESQFDLMSRHNCNEYQGFYFYKPVTAEQIEEIFRNQSGPLKTIMHRQT